MSGIETVFQSTSNVFLDKKNISRYGNRISIDFGKNDEKIEIYGLGNFDFHFRVYSGSGINFYSSDTSSSTDSLKNVFIKKGFTSEEAELILSRLIR